MEEYLLGVEVEPNQAAEALGHFQAVLQERPQSFWAHYRAAAAAFRLGDHATAARYLRRCIDQRPRNAALRTQLSTCLFGLGQLDTALEQCDMALVIDPDHTISTRNRTFIRRRLGQIEDLMADIRRLILLSRGRKESFAIELRFASTLGKDAADLRALAPNALEDDPSSGILRAVLLRDSGRPHDALLELDKVLDLDHEHLQARYRRSMLLRTLDNVRSEQAVEDFAYLLDHPRFGELLAQDKQAVSVYHHRSTDLLRAGKVSEAVRVARQGLACAERLRIDRCQSHYTLARAYAASAKTRPDHVPLVLAELQAASKLQRAFVTDLFERDPYFSSLRDELRPKLVGCP